MQPDAFDTPSVPLWGDLWLCALAVMGLGALIAARDRWLGGAVAWLGLSPLLFPLWRAEILTVAIVAALLTFVPVTTDGITRSCQALAWFGFAQAVVVILQWRGIDPLYDGLRTHATVEPGGTFSHPGTAGAFLAMTGLVAPSWMLAVIAVGVFATRSRGAILALLIGMAIRYWPLSKPSLVVLAMVAVIAVTVLAKSGSPLQSLTFRHAVQSGAVWHMLTTAPVFGLGFALWPLHKRAVEVDPALNGPGATLDPLHNDLAQWIAETGLGGCLLLLGWLRSRWASFCASPVRPALAAAGVLALTWSPFHAVPTGAVIAVLLGLSHPTTQGA